MSTRRTGNSICFLLMISVATIFQGNQSFGKSAAIGVLARSINTTVAGQPVPDRAVIFSGDTVHSNAQGTAIIEIVGGNRVILDQQSEATFYRNENGVTVRLSHGAAALYRPSEASKIRVEAGGMVIDSGQGGRTMGKMAINNGELMVRANVGSLRVTRGSQDFTIAQGKTVSLSADRPVDAAMVRFGPTTHVLPNDGAQTATLAAPSTNKAGPARADLKQSFFTGAWRRSPEGPHLDATRANQNALDHVGAHVPPEACEHAASPSVPAAVCVGR